MRLTERYDIITAVDKNGIEYHVKGIKCKEGYDKKLCQLEDIEELCIKMTTQPIYEKFFNNNICKLEFIGHNTAYDFKNNCIIVYKGHSATIYFVNEYGKSWALTKEELL